MKNWFNKIFKRNSKRRLKLLLDDLKYVRYDFGLSSYSDKAFKLLQNILQELPENVFEDLNDIDTTKVSLYTKSIQDYLWLLSEDSSEDILKTNSRYPVKKNEIYFVYWFSTKEDLEFISKTMHRFVEIFIFEKIDMLNNNDDVEFNKLKVFNTYIDDRDLDFIDTQLFRFLLNDYIEVLHLYIEGKL